MAMSLLLIGGLSSPAFILLAPVALALFGVRSGG